MNPWMGLMSPLPFRRLLLIRSVEDFDLTTIVVSRTVPSLAASDSVDSLGSLEDEMKAAELRRLS